jgi:superfamily II DNA or RNA helicase
MKQQQNLFDQPVAASDSRLESAQWPPSDRFPLNRRGFTAKSRVFADLAESRQPLIVAGYASLTTIVEFLSGMPASVEQARLLIGSEPTQSAHDSAHSRLRSVPEEAREYWLNRNFSILQSLNLVRAIEAVKAGRVAARVLDSRYKRLHAKLFVGDQAVTLGSSNFTPPGLQYQWEANARFEAAESKRYRETCSIAENYWAAGHDAIGDLLALLESLLRVVSWQEALARGCLELLDGDWAREYLQRHAMPGDVELWPSQVAGIAQALWVLETTGSVLVADATGAGKTRMGAHLLRSIADRSWRSGRMRAARTVLVGPPAVQGAWEHEASLAASGIRFISHGQLSRRSSDEHKTRTDEVRRAQVLAVDEAHNFLNPTSNRTQILLSNLADHTVLFTATPINRGATDLLRLADMLGADNLAPSTIKAFERLLGARSLRRTLTPREIETLREELQRFTVRRTKRGLNEFIDRDPDAYRDASGRRCRYPEHRTHTYKLNEPTADVALASRINSLAAELRGLAYLRHPLELPEALRREGWNEEMYLARRLRSAASLSAYQIRATLRSSACALVEHIAGTRVALEQYNLQEADKRSITGNVLETLSSIAGTCPPNRLRTATPPVWLSDPEQHRGACAEDRARYEEILHLVKELSPSRDEAKVELIRRLAGDAVRILAFDSRPITLALLETRLRRGSPALRTLRATGERASERRKALRLLAPEATPIRLVVLASDAMAEGVNLQGASTVVHLDMPSVVRIAEQRVGRVDRMDSPHTAVDVYWPMDAPEFALRSDEKFVERYETVETLLGSNMPLPEDMRPGEVVDATRFAKEVEEQTTPWDGIQDAFSPVREIVEGPRALVPAEAVTAYRGVSSRVLSRVSVLRAESRWAFVCLAASANQAPRWIYVAPGEALRTRLDEVAEKIRGRLTQMPETLGLTERSMNWLSAVVEQIQRETPSLLPRRKQVALREMAIVVARYFEKSAANGDGRVAEELRALAESVERRESDLDWDAVADTWLDLVRPTWYARLTSSRRLVLLKDIRKHLIEQPLDPKRVLDAFRALPTLPPLESRVAACILGLDSP